MAREYFGNARLCALRLEQRSRWQRGERRPPKSFSGSCRCRMPAPTLDWNSFTTRSCCASNWARRRARKSISRGFPTWRRVSVRYSRFTGRRNGRSVR